MADWNGRASFLIATFMLFCVSSAELQREERRYGIKNSVKDTFSHSVRAHTHSNQMQPDNFGEIIDPSNA